MLQDIVDALIPAIFVLVAGAVIAGGGWVIYVDSVATKQLAEYCIAEGMQWVNGSCVK